ncbi:MAG: tRNA pseudouridine(38-40) synthase TruA [Bacteroidetes bacterium]|nr:tRNA pseudouridine(38-40) synthase TruA [Bacteroidota bacterium]
MKNYKLTIQYDGTNYAGWQIQKSEKTIQGEITTVLHRILQEDVTLVGSGRTDAGVHAMGQVANFLSEKDREINKLRHSINGLLPNDISVTEIVLEDEKFHSRFDARKRSYIYLISHFKSPFYHNYSYYYHPILDHSIEELNEISSAILGEHDFTSFCRTKTEIENKICTIENIRWRKNETHTIMLIEANRFLHGMVRTIVGSVIFAAKNKLGGDYLLSVLDKKDRIEAAEAVPAKGLFLYKVRY